MQFGIEVDDPAAVPDAVADHRLVVCRGAALDLADQIELTSRMGRLVGHADGIAQVRHEDDRRMPADHAFFNEQWHADVSWSVEGPVVSVLVALEAGRFAAPTSFVDTVSGLAALPPHLRPADGARAWHHVEQSRRHRHGRGSSPTVEGRDPYRPPPVPWPGARPPTLVDEPGAARPLLVTHGRSGAVGLSIGDHAWTGDPDDPTSPAGIDALQAALVDGGARHTHRWRRGDLIAWDNRSLLHRREPGRSWGRRVLRRTAAWPAD